MASVTEADLVAGLKTLGLEAGDVAFVHSSLRSFGHVEGGAEAVVRAFLEVLGPEGTLAAPTFGRYFTEGPDQVWDRQATPSRMGRISETVRTWAGAVRSPHAVHPVSAVGALAGDLADRDHGTDFAFDSPFSRLLELGAWIVLLGVTYNSCTLIHILEERTEIPWRRWVERVGKVVDGGVSTRKTYRFLERYPGVGNDFLPLGERMERAGLVRIEKIGESTVRCFRARDLYDTGLRALRQDPLFLVSAKTKAEAAGHMPPYGELLEGRPERPALVPSRPAARRLAEALSVRQAPGGRPEVEVRNRWETPDGLVLEELRFPGPTGGSVPGMLAMPQARKAPLPAVVCLHGTGGSWERLMEARFFSRGSTLVGWARELARRGFATLAITQFSHPPRWEPWDWEWAKLLPAYGETAMGWLVGDAVACVDYLRTRPEVDAGRIGVSGFSLGGIAAFYGFATDERIAAAAVFCGGVGSVRDLVRLGDTRFHSVYYYVPGLLARELDHPALVSELAPRPLLVCGTREDRGMPEAGLRAFEQAAREAYGAAEAADRFRMLVESGPHALTPRAFEEAAAFFRARL